MSDPAALARLMRAAATGDRPALYRAAAPQLFGLALGENPVPSAFVS